MVLVWGCVFVRHLSSQFGLGGPTQLASDRSCTQRPDGQERSSRLAALSRRTVPVSQSSCIADRCRRPGVASALKKRKAIPASGVGLPRCHRRGQAVAWQDLLPDAVLPHRSRRGRGGVRTVALGKQKMVARGLSGSAGLLGSPYAPVWRARPSLRDPPALPEADLPPKCSSGGT